MTVTQKKEEFTIYSKKQQDLTQKIETQFNKILRLLSCILLHLTPMSPSYVQKHSWGVDRTGTLVFLKPECSGVA